MILMVYSRPMQGRTFKESGWPIYQSLGLMPGARGAELGKGRPLNSLPRPISMVGPRPAIGGNDIGLGTLEPTGRGGARLMLRDAPGRKPDALRPLIV